MYDFNALASSIKAVCDIVAELVTVQACSGQACPCSRAAAALGQLLQATDLRVGSVCKHAQSEYPGLLGRMADQLLQGQHVHAASLAVAEAYNL
jgi:hypothetical protein